MLYYMTHFCVVLCCVMLCRVCVVFCYWPLFCAVLSQVNFREVWDTVSHCAVRIAYMSSMHNAYISSFLSSENESVTVAEYLRQCLLRFTFS